MTTPLEERELIDERPDERLDRARLALYLHGRLPGAEDELSIRQFAGGKANLTYLLAFGPREFVLRRPPLGPLAPGAHDMRREHRVLSVLHRAYPPAPQSFLLCEDESVVGAPFHILERRRGIVVWEDMPAEFSGRPELNRRIGFALVDALADLHRVDPAAVGLETLGRPAGYVERQLAGWTRRWQAAEPDAEAVAVLRPVLDRLAARLPRAPAASLVHNDYRLDNVLLDAADPARVVAVLDWDMCTLGDPLADLGYLLNYWVEPGESLEWREVASMPTWRAGFPTRAEAIARYAARTGFELGEVRWHEIFAAFKLAVIIQQIYIRWRRGQTQDDRFRDYGGRVAALARKAAVLAGLG
ncbi:MAG TPA: phosphotransferase family protein [Stellaceae bacterium]|nr:phosphotransferase family protein [Stellaceae bacterium]